MKRKDTALNPGTRKKAAPDPSKPRLVCGHLLESGEPCQNPVNGPWPCRHHGGPGREPGSPPELPHGVKLPVVFKGAAEQQAELESFVAGCLDEYQLNTVADVRQVLMAGVAYVRLMYSGASIEPKDADYFSRIVDRHLRNLRATPKEQAAGRHEGDPPGVTDPGKLLAAGIGVGGFLERARQAMGGMALKKLAAGEEIEQVGGQPVDTAAPDPFS